MLRRIRSWIKRKNAGTRFRFHAEIGFLNLDVILFGVHLFLFDILKCMNR